MATRIFDSPEFLLEETGISPVPAYPRDAGEWSPDCFAREQIRGLVRQVFFSSATRPVRQVVFSAVEAGTDVASICRQVGEALASETQASIAVVYPDAARREGHDLTEPLATGLHRTATRVTGNLWLVPDGGYFSAGDMSTVRLGCTRLGYSRLAELRREFEYSLIQCPPAGESSEAAALGQLADGIILVLAAHRTRRATARTIVDTLCAAQVQLLGTVLSDRTFPIPEGIYKRL